MSSAPRVPLQIFAVSGRAVGGYSLLEMLAVICLIGIFGGLTIASYASGQKEALERLLHQRNAQEIVSLGVCATVSGADFVVRGDKQTTVENLIIGTVGQHGQWHGKTFRLVNLPPTALPGALAFVKFDDDLLLYDPAGGQH